MAAKCGAKARSTGQTCLQPVPKAGLRCRFHGGRSTGPKTKAGRAKMALQAVTHGIYGDKITEEESRWGSSLKAGEGLEHEIFVARLQIRRALSYWATWEAANPEDQDQLPVVEIKTSTTAGQPHHAEIHRRRPDLWAIIDRALARVGRLVEVETKVIEVRDLEALVRDQLTRTPDHTNNGG